MKTTLSLLNKCLASAAMSVMLMSCGGGGGNNPAPPVQLPTPPTPTPMPTPTPTPTPTGGSPDLTQDKLLSDAELRTPALSRPPVNLQIYTDWLASNHQPIRSVTYDRDFSDLRFLSGLIGDKTIVQLGESSHGTREFNQVKTRLIKYLHQEMGFSVVAFESGFFDGFQADRGRSIADPNRLMRFLFPVWHTDEVFELFRYIQESQSTSNPLRIAGFDTQVSSSFFNEVYPFIDALPSATGVSATQKTALRNALTNYQDMQIDFSRQSCFSRQNATCDQIVSEADSIRAALVQSRSELLALGSADRDVKILYITAFAAIGQIDNSLASYRTRDTGNVRDEAMADIFQQLRSELFPGEKIVIWAHNRHVALGQSPTQPIDSISNYPSVPMGFHLRAAFPDDLYTIGLYMLRGATADNGGTSIPVSIPRDNSLEAIAYSIRKAALFVDTSASQTREDGNDFIFERTEAFYWGGAFGQYSIIPSDQYDGILFIDRSTVPAYR